MPMGLYQVDNPLDKVSNLYGQASNSLAAMTKNQETTIKGNKSIGGGLSSAAGLGMAGFAVGGGVGAAIGAGVGLLSYFLS